MVSVAAIPPLLLLVLALKALLNYFFDPYDLKRYPAPSIAAFSNLWSAYHSRRLRRSRAIFDAHRSLGPIVRVQPKHLSFADPRAVQDIYGHKTTTIKDDFYLTLSGGKYEHIVGTRDRQEHATKRKYVSRAFSQQQVLLKEPLVRAKVEKLVRRLDQAAEDGKPIDIRKWLNLFTFDVISDIGLSFDPGFLDKGESMLFVNSQNSNRPHAVNPITAFQNNNIHVASIGHWPSLLPLSKPISRLLRLPHSCSGDDFDAVCLHELKTRLEATVAEDECNKATDLLQHLLVDSQGRNRNLPFGELLQEVAVFLSAGSDTTASSMTGTLYLLMKSPESLARLRMDLDAALNLESSQVVAPYAKVNGLRFFRACLDEGLRLLPPASIGPLRQTHPEGATIAGQHVKGGVTVSVPTFTLHHDPALFPDPHKFNPSRWIDGTAEERMNLAQYCIPFTAGKHSCLGRNIAFLEAHVVLGTLLYRYEFDFTTTNFELQILERINANPGPMPVYVRRRH